ncbi:MAG TPA: cytochrome c [Methylovirgula sp.]|jgi:cytochrome c oxidase cbb3-type subunit 3|nr:cytochrome c [Methylovirgula sp.]
MYFLFRTLKGCGFGFGIGLVSLAAFGFGTAAVGAEAPQPSPTTAGEPLSVPATTLFPGDHKAPPVDPNAQKYENDAKAIAEGAKLFNWMNCSGCHFHGAGGMGPAFFNDGHFIYGGRLDQIYASIAQGRPNGMPSWAQTLSQEQIWQLAAYVKSLSTGNPQPVMPPDTSTESKVAPAPEGSANP